MIISAVKKISREGASQYAWRHLSQFQNTEFTTQAICSLHGLSDKHRHHAQRQSEQIKYCLSQAKEYYDAAKSVSLATRPVLLYYSVMSMALAEVLLKQDGNSRLSRLRETDNCHGLALSVVEEPSPNESLLQSSSKLVAKQQIGAKNNAKGTFEVWRRSAREHPIAGNYVRSHGIGGETRTFTILFGAEDKEFATLPTEGLSLFACLTNLPYMSDTLSMWGECLDMVRATVSANNSPREEHELYSLIVQPTAPRNLERFGNLIMMPAWCVNELEIFEYPAGYSMKWKSGMSAGISLPHSIHLNTEDIYFSCSKNGIGEFGYLYVALHILGNFARYYPDIWLRHIEKNSPLANTAESLCSYANERLPILTLSEMTRTYYVVEK